MRAAVLDVVPGNPNHPGRTAIKLGDDDGALLVGELEAPLGGGKLLLGRWHYTARFDRNDGTGTGKGNAGTYFRCEFPPTGRAERKVDAFFRRGKAAGRFNMFGGFASTGLKFSGWGPGRDEDEFGIALAAAFTSNSYRAATSAARSEVAIEATYRAPIAARLAVQPSIHYIRNRPPTPASPMRSSPVSAPRPASHWLVSSGNAGKRRRPSVIWAAWPPRPARRSPRAPARRPPAPSRARRARRLRTAWYAAGNRGSASGTRDI